MDPKTWLAAVGNPTDIGSAAKVGLESYRDAMGGTSESGGETWENLIRAVAKLFCLAFSKSSPSELMELRDCLEGRGAFVEPAIGEPVSDALAHHFLIEDSIKQGRSTTLLEMFAMAHDIEAYIRPGFLRLLWAAETASANSRKPYPAYHLDADGKERSVGYALKRLRDWQARWSSAVLDDPEAKTFEEFLDSVSRRRLKR